MTALAGPQTTLPFRRGPTRAAVALDSLVRRVHAVAATWWYVPLARLSRATARTASRLHARVDTWRRLRETRNALLELDERTLQDIGLTRYDVERLTRVRLAGRYSPVSDLYDPLAAIHRWHI